MPEKIGFREVWECSVCGDTRPYGIRAENTTGDGHGHIFKEGAFLRCGQCLCLTNHFYTHTNRKWTIKDFSTVSTGA